MNAKTPVPPGIKIEEHTLAAGKFRRAEDHAPLTVDLSAFFFEHDSAARNLTFQCLFHPHCHIGKNTVVVPIQTAGNGQNSPDNDGSCADDQIVVRRETPPQLRDPGALQLSEQRADPNTSRCF